MSYLWKLTKSRKGSLIKRSSKAFLQTKTLPSAAVSVGLIIAYRSTNSLCGYTFTNIAHSFDGWVHKTRCLSWIAASRKHCVKTTTIAKLNRTAPLFVWRESSYTSHASSTGQGYFDRSKNQHFPEIANTQSSHWRLLLLYNKIGSVARPL